MYVCMYEQSISATLQLSESTSLEFEADHQASHILELFPDPTPNITSKSRIVRSRCATARTVHPWNRSWISFTILVSVSVNIEVASSRMRMRDGLIKARVRQMSCCCPLESALASKVELEDRLAIQSSPIAQLQLGRTESFHRTSGLRDRY